MNIIPEFKYDNKQEAFFCNCPDCNSVVGKISYGYKYEGGVALDGYSSCKKCNKLIDWTNIVDRFQIDIHSTVDIELSNKYEHLIVGLTTENPKKYPNNMDKCMAILNSLKEGANKYLAKTGDTINTNDTINTIRTNDTMEPDIADEHEFDI